MQKYSFFEFVDMSRQAHTNNPNWRLGQSYFNVLHRLRPDLANKVRSTNLDTFYNDTRIPAFLAHIKEHWDD